MSERTERTALALIVIVVGVLAGRASFSHVVQWSMDNLPDGTPRSYGYTNATVSELLPIGVLLFVRSRRRRGGTPGVLAWTMLIAAGLFSLTAQFAVAVPSLSGWVVAAVPTLAFMALTKLLLAMKPVMAASPVADEPAALARQPSLTSAADNPKVDATRPAQAAMTSPITDSRRTVKRARPRSLTSATRIEAALAELGPTAKPAEIAARVGVSESTARRHMPKQLASSSRRRPAEMAMSA